MSDYDELMAKRAIMIKAWATEVGERAATEMIDVLLERVRKIEEKST